MKRIIILLLSFVIVLSGCSLFPLKEDVKSSTEASETESQEAAEGNEKPGNLVKPAEVNEDSEESHEDVMYCISPANIRDAASSNSSVIGALRTGDKVYVLSRVDSWVEIAHEGQSGFVYERFLSDTEP